MSACNFIFPARGFVHVIGGRQPGIYKVEGLDHEGVLITGVDRSDEDIIQRQQSINGLRILYTAGPAFGEIGIAGDILLGTAEAANKTRVSAISRWFQAHRTSGLSRKGVRLSIGDEGLLVAPHRLTLSQADPELNIQSFFIQGSVVTPASK